MELTNLANGISALVSRPFYNRRHRRKNRLDVATGLEAENSTAVIKQIEFDIAAAADQLLLAIGFAPWRREVFSHQTGIDAKKGAANILREGKSLVPVGFEIVVKNAADTARFVAVLEEKVIVAPFLVFIIRRDLGVRVTGRFHRRMKSDAVRVVLYATPVEHRREVSTAAEPGLAGHNKARVHVH